MSSRCSSASISSLTSLPASSAPWSSSHSQARPTRPTVGSGVWALRRRRSPGSSTILPHPLGEHRRPAAAAFIVWWLCANPRLRAFLLETRAAALTAPRFRKRNAAVHDARAHASAAVASWTGLCFCHNLRRITQQSCTSTQTTSLVTGHPLQICFASDAGQISTRVITLLGRASVLDRTWPYCSSCAPSRSRCPRRAPLRRDGLRRRARPHHPIRCRGSHSRAPLIPTFGSGVWRPSAAITGKQYIATSPGSRASTTSSCGAFICLVVVRKPAAAFLAWDAHRPHGRTRFRKRHVASTRRV